MLESKRQPISGSYLLNCELPGGQSMHKRRKTEALDKDNRRLIYERRQPLNASMYTKEGSINLNLATGGRTPGPSKAHVQVSSKEGKVHVNLHSLQMNKHICLEVSAEDGNIALFVPVNFIGALQLRTRRGTIRFLPEFERRARHIRSRSDDSLVLFGRGVQAPSFDLNDLMSDCCLLSSRHGNITVGVSGIDYYEDAGQSGLLDRLGSLSMAVLGKDHTTHLRTGMDAMRSK